MIEVANAAYPNKEKVSVVLILHKIRILSENVSRASKIPNVKERL